LLRALKKLFPLIIRPSEPWDMAVSLFAMRLRDRLGEKLRYVIASPSEDLLVYDSNVLVVVNVEDFEVRKDVVEVESEVEKEFSWKIGISPLITKENNEALIKNFINSFYEKFPSNEAWMKAVVKFSKKLRDRLGEKLRYVIASPSEDLLVYDSNVLVVVDAEDFEVRKDVIEIEGEVEKEFSWKIGISPLITKENNEAKLFIEVFGWKNIKY